MRRVRLGVALALAGAALASLAACRPPARQSAPAASASANDGITLATYNIRHGRGMDGRVDLERTANAIRAFDADLVALQEVDRLVARSGRGDEPAILGGLLGMAHAFGAFMPYQGGEYGMAILSRFPIRRTQVLRLPDGNEPRVALVVEVEPRPGRRLLAVNVHFDWVDDDRFRYAQVEQLATVLDTVSIPVVLLGDFNDVPGTRTLTRWSARFLVAAKPAGDRFTFPSTKPEREIDHILLAPTARWATLDARVVSDSVTSDHRAMVARVRLLE